jgi:hypothetical protein
MNKNISEILLKYKSDKNFGIVDNIYENLDTWKVVDNPTEKRIGHTYGKIYQMIFNNFDINSNIKILEIGIQRGGSLMAWKEYFNNADIYGIDIFDSILPEYRNDKFNYIISDVKSESVKEKLKNINFDIIIDDGSHTLYDIFYVVENFKNKLNSGGFLIIEDCPYVELLVHEIQKTLSENYYELLISDLRNEGGGDNFMTIIKKK